MLDEKYMNQMRIEAEKAGRQVRAAIKQFEREIGQMKTIAIPEKGEIYRHRTGRLYQITGLPFCANTGTQMIEYREAHLKVYEQARLWRPELEFADWSNDKRRWVHLISAFNELDRFELVRGAD